MNNSTENNPGRRLLEEARNAWTALAEFRRKRRRCRDFTFGRQWGDVHRLSDGRIISEESAWLDAGRVPICNNLIRQLVKSIVGRWRFDRASSGGDDNRDARSFEEFLISGCAAQRISDSADPADYINVSPARLIFGRFSAPDASDCNLIGMLHDMEPSEIMRRFAPESKSGFRNLASRLAAISTQPASPLATTPTPCCAAEIDFLQTDTSGTLRVVEVWKKEYVTIMRIHDPKTASYTEEDWSEKAENRFLRLCRRRKNAGDEAPVLRLDYVPRWKGSWLLADGSLLAVMTAGSHPFVLSLYPMVDGEVHSLVEDVIDQQKSVNNLVMLLDSVLRASAKGVVLFPTDQLPRGMTWEDVRRIWAEPGGILPFRRTSKNVMPYQLNQGGTLAGAGQLLDTQMRLFNEISGTNASSRGSASTAKGAEMMNRELEQASVSIFDLLSSFEDFLTRRNALLADHEIS